jgi:hypothetical protein
MPPGFFATLKELSHRSLIEFHGAFLIQGFKANPGLELAKAFSVFHCG